MRNASPHRKLLIIGDTLAILVLSLAGFWFHYQEIVGFRWLSTFIPVLVGWFLVAPWLGVYREDLSAAPAQAWRAGLAAFLSAPLAAWLRGAWLSAAIVPVFVLVLASMNALGMIFWRLVWFWVAGTRKWTKQNG